MCTANMQTHTHTTCITATNESHTHRRTQAHTIIVPLICAAGSIAELSYRSVALPHVPESFDTRARACAIEWQRLPYNGQSNARAFRTVGLVCSPRGFRILLCDTVNKVHACAYSLLDDIRKCHPPRRRRQNVRT